jgi:hypothetical protein
VTSGAECGLFRVGIRVMKSILTTLSKDTKTSQL